MDLKIEINENQIKTMAAQLAQKEAENAAVAMVRAYFRPENEIMRHSKGIGYQIIEKHIDDILTGDQLAQKIQKIISAKLDGIIEEATTEAMKHKAKKIAFQKVAE